MRKAVAAFSLVFFLACAGPAPALDKLVMGYTGIGVGAEIHHLAKDAGLFKKHGLDVEIIYIPAGSTAVQAMVSDQISVGWGNDAAGVVASYAAGVTLKLTAVLANKFVYSFVTPAGIARPQDLKGKSIAVSRFGSGSDFITRMALKSWGLDARDVTILQIGNSPARLGALAAGRVHGSILSLSQTPRAKKMGLRVMADLSQIDVEYPQGVVYAAPAFIAKKPDQMLRFTRAYVEAVSLFKTSRQAALPMIEKYTGMPDKEEAAEYYDTFVKNFLQDFPQPSTPALRTLLEDVARGSPKAKDLRPQDLVDLRFLNEVKGR